MSGLARPFRRLLPLDLIVHSSPFRGVTPSSASFGSPARLALPCLTTRGFSAFAPSGAYSSQTVGTLHRSLQSLTKSRVYGISCPVFAAWFNSSIFGGDKNWVAGVELATASEPPARKPRIWGRRPAGADPSHPRRCNLLLNLPIAIGKSPEREAEFSSSCRSTSLVWCASAAPVVLSASLKRRLTRGYGGAGAMPSGVTRKGRGVMG
jgi:hypothetical protein